MSARLRTVAALLMAAWLAALAWAAPPEGTLRVLVFDAEGRPAVRVAIAYGPARGETDALGVATLTTAPGRHALAIGAVGVLGQAEGVACEAGEVTEVIVRLGTGAAPARIHVEAPGAPKDGAPAPAGETAPEAPRAPGTVRGVVTSVDGAPIAGVQVWIAGSPATVRSDAAGAFTIGAPAGRRTLTLVHREFAARVLHDVEVPEGGVATVRPTMEPLVHRGVQVVRVPRLEDSVALAVDLERNSFRVEDVLSGSEIAKSGADNAASAVLRLPGLTVVGGRFVYVRGMGERYSSTLLNGSTLPSPEPERRVVPLDLFPAGVIETVSVSKAYSPELPGEFGGGTVLIKTRGIPEAWNLSIGVSSGWLTRTTDRRGLTYDGGHRDWTGFDDGSRNLPSLVEQAAEAKPLHPDATGQKGYSLSELERFGESLTNVWSAERTRVPLPFGLSASVGNATTLLGGRFGYQVNAQYGNAWRIERGLERFLLSTGTGAGTYRAIDYEQERATNTIEGSASAVVGWEPAPGHALEWTALWVRLTDDFAERYEGYYEYDDTDVRVTTIGWTEEQLLVNQLRGTHTVWDRLELGWRYAFSTATRYEPDLRTTRYDWNAPNQEWRLSIKPESNSRRFNELTDFNHDAGISARLPLHLWGNDPERPLRLEAGGGVVLRDRESETRRFKFIPRGPDSGDPTVLALPTPELIFVPPYIGANGFSLEEITLATDSYEADQTLLAGYVKADVPMGPALDASLGLRLEASEQTVTTFNLFEPAASPITASLDTTDLLPALNLTWRFREGMQLRAGYSRTLSRPDFRDLSEAQVELVVGAGAFIGSADLERTVIESYDVRWEWYPDDQDKTETVSLGLFYKTLTDPIETVIYAGATPIWSLQNADGATNVGLETEFRVGLDWLADGRWLRGAPTIADHLALCYVSGNLALIRSRVRLDDPGIATNDDRPLQGQSEWVVNLAVGYENEASGLSVSVLYNVFGPRIHAIGTYGIDDAYEQPFHQLDVVLGYRWSERCRLGLTVKNLLDWQGEITQHGDVLDRYRKGTSIGVSLTTKF